MNLFTRSSSRLCNVTALRLGFAGITSVVVLLTWLGIVSIRKKISAVEDQSTAHLALLEQEQNLHASSRELSLQILTLNQTILSLREKLPNTAEETQFLQQLSERATVSGVSLGEFRPGGVSQRKNCKEIELRLRGTGTYAALARWLHSLRQVPRILRIADLNITAPSQPGGDCSVEIRIDLLFGLNSEQLVASKVKK